MRLIRATYFRRVDSLCPSKICWYVSVDASHPCAGTLRRQQTAITVSLRREHLQIAGFGVKCHGTESAGDPTRLSRYFTKYTIGMTSLRGRSVVFFQPIAWNVPDTAPNDSSRLR